MPISLSELFLKKNTERFTTRYPLVYSPMNFVAVCARPEDNLSR